MKSTWKYAFIAALAATLSTSNVLGQSAAMADGEIRKVDKDAAKLTIKHGPIPSMDMPPMTMVYRVKDPAMLGRVKAGDKVKFDAVKEGGQYVVTTLQPAK
jgi:Cu/Ag efflux protein CusF